MADFPAIVPNQRTFGLGNAPQSEYESPDGVGVRFLFNKTKRVGQTLSLAFIALTETQINSITNHFIGQEGSLVPFDLPSQVWSGYSTIPVNSSDYKWRYASSFSVESNSAPGRFNVEVELVTTPN
jgi:hypothetical protein|tara:strand:+ start:119 stop:496 length:378 start_codon:yes stop_codon:yes gene_type:complete